MASVSEIAYRVGFNNPSYFHKVFKNHYKVSPGDTLSQAHLVPLRKEGGKAYAVIIPP